MTLRYERLTGPSLKAIIDDLARLRIVVFREWPYLYSGDMDYEQDYLKRFADAPGAVVVGAWLGDTLVGASTAAPLAGEFEAFRDPVVRHGYDPAKVFYFGKSVLLPEYRGRGAGHAFFDHREAHARQYGQYTHTAFCAVMRADDDARMPSDYRPLDPFWRRRGYQPVSGMEAVFPWTEIGAERESEQTLQFWIRELR